MNVVIDAPQIDTTDRANESIVELGDLQLCLVGGGIGETILVAPKG